MKEHPQHVTVIGAIHGDYVLEEERPDGSLLLRPAPYPAVFPSYPGRPATDAEFAQFESEHGPFRSPDGEG